MSGAPGSAQPAKQNEAHRGRSRERAPTGPGEGPTRTRSRSRGRLADSAEDDPEAALPRSESKADALSAVEKKTRGNDGGGGALPHEEDSTTELFNPKEEERQRRLGATRGPPKKAEALRLPSPDEYRQQKVEARIGRLEEYKERVVENKPLCPCSKLAMLAVGAGVIVSALLGFVVYRFISNSN
jgi:hypothetical protein